MSYGKVHDVYWEDDKIETLSDRAALLALFLITGPHRNAIGCFKLGMGTITDNLRFQKWGIEGVSEALRELIAMGFMVRDDRTGWTFIINALKHDPIKGAKAAIHAARLALKVPANLPVYQALKAKLEPQIEAELKGATNVQGWPMRAPSMPIGKGIDTPSIPQPSPSPSPLPSPEPEPSEPKGSGAVAPQGPDPKPGRATRKARARSDASELGDDADQSTETRVFSVGKRILGKSAGGLITKLRRVDGMTDARALELLSQAQAKESPREWIGAIIRDGDPEGEFQRRQDEIYRGVLT